MFGSGQSRSKLIARMAKIGGLSDQAKAFQLLVEPALTEAGTEDGPNRGSVVSRRG